MKKVFFLITIGLFLACSKDDSSSSGSGSSGGSSIDRICGTYNGKTLYKGSSGGCYYINSNKNKTYVDKKNCKC